MKSTHFSSRRLNKKTMYLGAVLLFLMVVGVLGFLYVQYIALRESQDLRQQASIAGGTVELSFDTATTITPQTQSTVTFKVNTNNLQTDGVQLVFDVTSPEGILNQAPSFQLASGVNLQSAYNQVTEITNGYRVSAIFLPSTVGGTFSTSSSTTLATLTFTPQNAGSIVLAFDADNSLSTAHGSDPVRDELKHVASLNLTVADAQVNNNKNDNQVDQNVNRDANQQNQNQNQTNQDQNNNNNANNNNDQASAPDQGLSRGCNEYCADSRECGGDYTCYGNRCRNPQNLESTSCAAATGGAINNNVTNNTATNTPQNQNESSQNQIIASGTGSSSGQCNSSCQNHADCAANMLCYSQTKTCRLAAKPTDATCGGTTVTQASVAPTPSPVTQVTPSPAASTTPFVQQPTSPQTNTQNQQNTQDTGTPEQQSVDATNTTSTWPLFVGGALVFLTIAAAAYLYQRRRSHQPPQPLTPNQPTTSQPRSFVPPPVLNQKPPQQKPPFPPGIPPQQ